MRRQSAGARPSGLAVHGCVIRTKDRDRWPMKLRMFVVSRSHALASPRDVRQRDESRGRESPAEERQVRLAPHPLGKDSTQAIHGAGAAAHGPQMHWQAARKNWTVVIGLRRL